MRRHAYPLDPYDEEPAAPETRPASLQSGLAEVESLVGDRFMVSGVRHEMLNEGQMRRMSADDRERGR